MRRFHSGDFAVNNYRALRFSHIAAQATLYRDGVVFCLSKAVAFLWPASQPGVSRSDRPSATNHLPRHHPGSRNIAVSPSSLNSPFLLSRGRVWPGPCRAPGNAGPRKAGPAGRRSGAQGGHLSTTSLRSCPGNCRTEQSRHNTLHPGWLRSSSIRRPPSLFPRSTEATQHHINRTLFPH